MKRLRIHAALTFLVALSTGCGGNEPPEINGTSSPPPGSDHGSTDVTTTAGEARGRILFFGDSITAGYGLDPEQAFPALVQERIDDRDWPFEAVNGGLSGETSAGGLRRIDWMLREPVDVFVLELGGNDGLRGIHPTATKSNLIEIVKRVREQNPEVSVVVAGMRMPPNLGRQFAEQFAAVFPTVAEETGAVLIPFIGKDVVGKTRLLQMDGIHPTAAGHEVIAETVWEYLEPVLHERMHAAEGA